jgi:prepilin-type N-terminal cleavage/methylation domain-containing protein
MKAKFSPQTRQGFTLIELMIVVGIIGLLATLAVPNLAKARDTSRLNIIYSNLRLLDAAKDQWALDNNQTAGALIANISVLSGYLRYGGIPNVVNETYVPNAVGTPPEADLPPGVSLGPYGPGAVIPAP